jgi:hypothetical protein
MSPPRRELVFGLVVPGLAACVCWILLAARSDELGHAVWVHWNGSGVPDGSASVPAYIAWSAAGSAGVGWLAMVLISMFVSRTVVFGWTPSRMSVALGSGLSTGIATFTVGAAWAQIGATRPSLVGVAGEAVVAALVVGIVCAALVGLLARTPDPPSAQSHQ